MQTNDKTVELVHRVIGADGKPLAEISARYFNFNWQDVIEFQGAFIPPIVQRAMEMGKEFAEADAKS